MLLIVLSTKNNYSTWANVYNEIIFSWIFIRGNLDIDLVLVVRSCSVFVSGNYGQTTLRRPNKHGKYLYKRRGQAWAMMVRYDLIIELQPSIRWGCRRFVSVCLGVMKKNPTVCASIRTAIVKWIARFQYQNVNIYAFFCVGIVVTFDW